MIHCFNFCFKWQHLTNLNERLLSCSLTMKIHMLMACQLQGLETGQFHLCKGVRPCSPFCSNTEDLKEEYSSEDVTAH